METQLDYQIDHLVDGTYTTLLAWQEPSRFGVDRDRHVCEDILTAKCTLRWPRGGIYRLTVTRPIRGTQVVRHQTRLPLPVTWTALPHSDRAFGYTVLDRYPNTTHALVANHLSTFRLHHHGDITTATLRNVTGYSLPSGHDPRPRWAPRPELATSI